MILGKVIGTVVTTISHRDYKNRRLLVVQPLVLERESSDEDFIALDNTQAGIGDTVLVNREGNGARQVLRVTLKYVDGKAPVVSGLKRISKPGLRVYARKTEIPRVLGGLGLVIVSTSQGIMTGAQAHKAQLGGEVLAYVW